MKIGADKISSCFFNVVPPAPCTKLMKTLLTQGGALTSASGYQRLVVTALRGIRKEVCSPTPGLGLL